MANVNDALKRLFLKLGGDPNDLKDDVSVEDYIDDLQTVLSSIGKIEYFDVTISQNENDSDGTSDKTLEEITEAYNAGKSIRIVIDKNVYFGGSYTIADADSVYIYPTAIGFMDGSITTVDFTFYNYGSSDNFYAFYGSIESGNTVYTSAETIY